MSMAVWVVKNPAYQIKTEQKNEASVFEKTTKI